MRMEDYRYAVNNGIPRLLHNRNVKAFADTLPADARVLEVGAGYYDHQPFFAQKLEKLDYDERHDVDIVADAHDMPIEDDTYDVVLALSVLEHVHDPYQVVREIFRVTKPGGQVMAWVPFFFGVHAFPDDISRFTREGLSVVFERAGFEVTKADSDTYAGVVLNASDAVHFLLPRPRFPRLNKALQYPLVALTPLDRRFKLKTLYAGTELYARKPAAAA